MRVYHIILSPGKEVFHEKMNAENVGGRKNHNFLKEEHKQWLFSRLELHPELWRLSELNPDFVIAFPDVGTTFLNQGHIDRQRMKLRPVCSVPTEDKSEEDELDEEKKKPKSKAKKITSLRQTILNTANSLGDQALYLSELIDEKGTRKDLYMKQNNRKPVPVENVIVPKAMTEAELSTHNDKIKEKTKELVDLLISKRQHEATMIVPTDTTTEMKSVFIGYLADKRPNKRSYHFVSGRTDDMDPVAVDILSALYATHPRFEHQEEPRKIIKIKHDYVLKSRRNM